MTDSLTSLANGFLVRLFRAEARFTELLRTFQDAAMNQALRDAFEDHAKESEAHATRLKQICEIVGHAPSNSDFQSAVALVAEASTATLVEAGPIRDEALIAVAQKVEQYEISSYKTLLGWFGGRDWSEVQKLLSQSLREEELAYDTYHQVATFMVNEEVRRYEIERQKKA